MDDGGTYMHNVHVIGIMTQLLYLTFLQASLTWSPWTSIRKRSRASSTFQWTIWEPPPSCCSTYRRRWKHANILEFTLDFLCKQPLHLHSWSRRVATFVPLVFHLYILLSSTSISCFCACWAFLSQADKLRLSFLLMWTSQHRQQLMVCEKRYESNVTALFLCQKFIPYWMKQSNWVTAWLYCLTYEHIWHFSIALYLLDVSPFCSRFPLQSFCFWFMVSATFLVLPGLMYRVSQSNTKRWFKPPDWSELASLWIVAAVCP